MLQDSQKQTRFNDLIHYLYDKENLTQTLLLPGSDFKESDAGLYLAIGQAGISQSFADWCISGMQRTQKDSWLAELEKIGDLLQLSLLLVGAGKTCFEG